MPTSDIAQLYYLNRYPQHSLGLLVFLLYLPLGILLFLFRIALGVQVFLFAFVLPDVPIVQWFLCKLLCAALGITIEVENLDKKEDVEVYVSNYVTPFDHLVVHSLTQSVTPGLNMFNTLISTTCGFKYFGLASSNLSEFKKNISLSISENKVPLYFQPESKQTNGKALLRFKTWYFEVCTQVQPICIEVSRPFVNLKVSAFNSAYWMDVMAYLFSPCTSYKLRFLPVVQKSTLSEVDYAEKVRQDIAASLKVEPSEYSASDLLEWEKRIIKDVIRREQNQERLSTVNRTDNIEIQHMAVQVKEVLPMVPLNVINLDLKKSLNVDQTITNILEGRVFYIPETAASSSPQSQTTSKATTSTDKICVKQDSLCTAAQTFGKSAQERMLSYQERKQQLIAAARQRYIEKHGLDIVGSS